MRWLLTAVALIAPLSLDVPAAAQASDAQPPSLSLEALAERPFIADPQLSPDGRRVVARINTEGTTRLAVYDLSAGPTAQPRALPTERLNVRWFSWAGPSRILIGHSVFIPVVTGSGLQIVPATRLLRYDLVQDKAMPLGSGQGMLGDDVIFTDPDGRYILLSAQKDLDDTPSVERIDLATGASVEVQPKRRDIWSWFADPQGYVRGGIAYSAKSFTIHFRETPTGELKRSGRLETAEETAVDAIHLLPRSNAAVIVTNAPTGRFGVYHYQLGAPALGAPIFEHPDVDAGPLRLSPDGSRLEGVFYEDERRRAKWLVPELQEVQAQVDRTLHGKDNVILSRSRDGNIVLLWSGSGSDPGTYYVFDRKARRMNLFASPQNSLVDARLAEVRPVRYSARDGLTIPAYLTLPQGRDAKGLPLIVMPHGGPFVRDSYAFDAWVQLLASRGYAVLQPNFRGSTGYGRSFVEKGYGQWGKAMQDDLDDGVAWLSAQGLVDPKRVCLMGASYGGYAALWGAIRNPELYRCAISFAGVTDIRAMLKHDTQLVLAKRYWRQWRDRVQGEEGRDLAAVSPLQQAGRLTLPVLIAHGELDNNVPVDQGRRLVAALRSRAAPVQAAFYPNAGHGFDRAEDALDFLRRVEAFLEVHNPSTPAPRAAREPQLVSGAIEARDYPAESTRRKEEGEVRILYRVTPDGRVTDCRTGTSSGSPALDRATCRIAQERFQYRPARDAEGRFRESEATYSHRWRFPEEAQKASAAS